MRDTFRTRDTFPARVYAGMGISTSLCILYIVVYGTGLK